VTAVLALALPSVARAGMPPIVRPPNEGSMSPKELGEQLFAANCVRCHGIAGNGRQPASNAKTGKEVGPPLRGVGALTADFYLRTGYMPLNDARDQPLRTRPAFDARERKALVDYVASLGGGPAVPTPHPENGDVATGRELFTEHCAGCHQAVAEGGIMPGAKAPALDRATPTEVAEAVRIGPYVMPKFSQSDISGQELDSIVAYVQYAQDPDDAGGWGIDHLGPFPEGMVAWFVAIFVLVGTCVAIGKRGARP
jgi:ubiquinol-cytochrome c reductase cytochrome c subunit